MIQSRTHNRKIASSSLGTSGIVVGESECTSLSPPSIAFKQGTKPLTALRALQYKWLPTAPGVCVFTAVCVCTWMGKRRARIPSMGKHTKLYVTFTSLHLKENTISVFLKQKHIYFYVFHCCFFIVCETY